MDGTTGSRGDLGGGELFMLGDVSSVTEVLRNIQDTNYLAIMDSVSLSGVYGVEIRASRPKEPHETHVAKA